MGKKRRKKNRNKNGKWLPPKGSKAYFSDTSDDKFKQKHPIGYGFLCVLGITALILPVALYLIFVLRYDVNSPWLMLGWVGAFAVGIGLFNYVAIIIKQFMGHLLSILCFLLGAFMIWISLVQLGIL